MNSVNTEHNEAIDGHKSRSTGSHFEPESTQYTFRGVLRSQSGSVDQQIHQPEVRQTEEREGGYRRLADYMKRMPACRAIDSSGRARDKVI